MDGKVVRDRALLTIGLLLAAITGFSTFNAVPKFRDVFGSIGGELPAVTMLSLQFYPTLLALPLVVLAVWFAWPRNGRRGLAALVTGAACLVIVPLFLAAAMYLPVIRLGS